MVYVSIYPEKKKTSRQNLYSTWDPMGNNLNNSPPTSEYKKLPTTGSVGKMNPKQDGSPNKKWTATKPTKLRLNGI